MQDNGAADLASESPWALGATVAACPRAGLDLQRLLHPTTGNTPVQGTRSPKTPTRAPPLPRWRRGWPQSSAPHWGSLQTSSRDWVTRPGSSVPTLRCHRCLATSCTQFNKVFLKGQVVGRGLPVPRTPWTAMVWGDSKREKGAQGGFCVSYSGLQGVFLHGSLASRGYCVEGAKGLLLLLATISSPGRSYGDPSS